MNVLIFTGGIASKTSKAMAIMELCGCMGETLQKEETLAVFIDQDSECGQVKDAISFLELVQKPQVFAHNGKNIYSFVSDDMSIQKFLINGQDDLDCSDLLFNQKYMKEPISWGFYGNWPIASVIVNQQISNNLIEKNSFLNALMRTISTRIGQEEIKIFIISSTHGGTGSSVVNILATFLRERFKKNISLNLIAIGSHLDFTPKGSDAIIKSETFKKKDEEFLRNLLRQKDLYDRTYVVGSPEIITLSDKFYHTGGPEQLNPLTVIDIFTCQAIKHAIDGAAAGSYFFNRNEQKAIGYNDLRLFNEAKINISATYILSRMLNFLSTSIFRGQDKKENHARFITYSKNHPWIKRLDINFIALQEKIYSTNNMYQVFLSSLHEIQTYSPVQVKLITIKDSPYYDEILTSFIENEKPLKTYKNGPVTRFFEILNQIEVNYNLSDEKRLMDCLRRASVILARELVNPHLGEIKLKGYKQLPILTEDNIHADKGGEFTLNPSLLPSLIGKFAYDDKKEDAPPPMYISPWSFFLAFKDLLLFENATILGDETKRKFRAVLCTLALKEDLQKNGIDIKITEKIISLNSSSILKKSLLDMLPTGYPDKLTLYYINDDILFYADSPETGYICPQHWSRELVKYIPWLNVNEHGQVVSEEIEPFLQKAGSCYLDKYRNFCKSLFTNDKSIIKKIITNDNSLEAEFKKIFVYKIPEEKVIK